MYIVDSSYSVYLGAAVPITSLITLSNVMWTTLCQTPLMNLSIQRYLA